MTLVQAASEIHATFGDAAFTLAILAGVALIVWVLTR